MDEWVGGNANGWLQILSENKLFPTLINFAQELFRIICLEKYVCGGSLMNLLN